jgi:hypothetical protein
VISKKHLHNRNLFQIPFPSPFTGKGGIYLAHGSVNSHHSKAPYLKMESKCTGK